MDVNKAIGKFLLDSLDYSKDSGQSDNVLEAFRRLKETLGLPASELEKILERVKEIAQRGIDKYEAEMKEEVQVYNQSGIPLAEGAPILDHWPVKIEPDADDEDLHLGMHAGNPLMHDDDPTLWNAADWDGERDADEEAARPVAPRFIRQPPRLLPPPPTEEPAAPVQEMGGLQLAAGPPVHEAAPGPAISQPRAPQLAVPQPLVLQPFVPPAPRAPKKVRKSVCPDCSGPCSKKAARCRRCHGLFVKKQTAERKAAARQQ